MPYWQSGLLNVDVSAASDASLYSDVDYTTYMPFVGDVSIIYTGDLVTQIVTENTIGNKTVDFLYDVNDDVSVVYINNYGEATRTVTFEKDINEKIIAVHIV